MRKLIYIVPSTIALILAVSVSLMSVSAADTWYTDVRISTKNCITSIYDTHTGESISYAPTMGAITLAEFPILYEFGFRHRFTIPTTYSQYFLDGEGVLRGERLINSSDPEYSEYRNIKLSQFKYLTVTFVAGISYRDGFVVDDVTLNCGLTAGPDGIHTFHIQQQFVDYISDNIEINAYTFGVSVHDSDLLLFDPELTVFDLFSYYELELELSVSQQRPFVMMFSDIMVKLYTDDDVFANGLGSIEDAVEQGNKDILDKLDEMINLDAPGEDIGGEVDDAADDLDNANGAVDDATPDFDPDIMTGIPTELGGALSYIGTKLDLMLAGQFGTVTFFCLSFGVAMTLVGRAVR